jgi:hypothetical protein
MTKTCRLTAVVLAVLAISATVCETTLAQKKPKPTEPQLPFPVKYQAHFPVDAENILLHRINNDGLAVGGQRSTSDGRIHAVLYDSVNDVCVHVSDLVASEYAGLFLDGRNGAVAITDGGLIVGTTWNADKTTGWAFVVELVRDEDGRPTLQYGAQLRRIDNTLMPPETTGTRALDVNDMGDVLISYNTSSAERLLAIWNFADETISVTISDDFLGDLVAKVKNDGDWHDPTGFPRVNSWGQVVGILADGEVRSAFRLTPWADEPLEIFPMIDDWLKENATDVNDDGVFCGVVLQGTANTAIQRPYRCYDTVADDAPIAVETLTASTGTWARVCINSSCDLAVHKDGKAQLFHDSANFVFDVESLVDTSSFSSEQLSAWQSKQALYVLDMTDRYPFVNSNTIGQLCGHFRYTTGKGNNTVNHNVTFVLTPTY